MLTLNQNSNCNVCVINYFADRKGKYLIYELCMRLLNVGRLKEAISNPKDLEDET